jgi:hypothetical protein
VEEEKENFWWYKQDRVKSARERIVGCERQKDDTAGEEVGKIGTTRSRDTKMFVRRTACPSNGARGGRCLLLRRIISVNGHQFC